VREDDGRKLDHATLETMRIRAVKRVEAGARVEDVAAALGLSRSAVFGWMAAYREGGEHALRAKPVPGRPPKLSGAQLRTLYTLIEGSDPRQYQLEFALWTRELVQQLIWAQFRIRLSVVSVGRLLRTLGFSPQRPVFRASQQDPERVRRWREQDYPTIRAEAAQAGAVIYFADEAGIRSDYHSGTTWAPVGKTPVVASTGARHSVNMISAVTPKGRLRFSVFTGSMTAKVFLEFVRRLLHDEPGPVFLIVDGHPVHRSKTVREFIDRTDGRLRLFLLPPYSPELNPDEWVWKNVKHDRIGKAGITSAEDLRKKAERALRRLQRIPGLVMAFFSDPHIQYTRAV
jgi:transposase